MKKLALSVVVAVAATFAQADWTYDGKNITDGNWTIPASNKDGNLTLSTASAGSGAIDLNAPITDESGNVYHIVALNERTLQGKSVTSIVFPEGITTFNNYSLKGCSQLVTVEFPVGCKLQNTGAYTFQNCTKLVEVSFENCAELTGFGDRLFEGCTALETLKMPPNLDSTLSFGFSASFTALKRIEFLNYPASLHACWAAANTWSGCTVPAYQTRLYVPMLSEDSGWFTAGNKSNMTLWSALGDDVKAEYTSRFGTEELPYGLGKNSGKCKIPYRMWIMPVASEVKIASLTIEDPNDFNRGSPTPPYGVSEHDVGSQVDVSIGQYAVRSEGSRDYTLYEAWAGVFSKKDSSGDYVVISTNEARTATLSLDEEGTYKWTWLFRAAGRRFSPTVGGNGGAVRELSTPLFEGGYYLYGSTVKYEAVKEDEGAVFWAWQNGSGSDAVFTTDPIIETEFSSGMYLRACFKPMSFSYVTDSYQEHRLSDSYNSFTVTNATYGGDNAFILMHSIYGKYPGRGVITPNGYFSAFTDELDLTLPVEGGRIVVGIGAGAFNDNDSKWLKSMVLPSTLLKIEADAFAGAKPTVKTITFNSCPEIEENAFRNVPAGRILFLVSHKDAGWQAVINDPTQFTRWVAVDAEERAAWHAAHPDERRPLGKHLVSGQYVRYNDYDPGFLLLVR